MTTQFFLTSKKLLGLIILTTFIGCKQDKTETENDMVTNVLLKEWTGSFYGTPAFDQMKDEDLKEAVKKGMELHLVEIDIIANNTDQPTFENTIVEMERAGADLNRVFTYYGIIRSNMSTPESREIQAVLAPKLSEYSSKISQNEKLFQRIKAVYDASQKTPLKADQQRTELKNKSFLS